MNAPRAAVAPAPRFSAQSLLLFAMGLALFGSTFELTRIKVAGFMVHPVLLLTIPAFLLVVPRRFRFFPQSVAGAMLVFEVGWVLCGLLDTQFFYELPVKLFSTLLTVVTVALVVRSELDYRWGVLGLALGVALMASHGLFTGDIGSETFNPVEVGNKNAFSLYALPALLLSTHMVLQGGWTRMYRTLLMVTSLVILVTVFSSANRSGWLGAVVVGATLLITQQRRGATTVLVGLLLLGTIYILNNYLDVGVFERRLDQTINGYQSDDLREALFQQCFWIGIDHPILGIGPYQINFELAHRVDTTMPMIGPHNAVTFLFGAGGIVLFGTWLWLGRSLWKFGTKAFGKFSILHALIVLWVIRGCFSDEVLYSPAFAIAFGLTLGLGMIKNPAPSAVRDQTAQKPVKAFGNVVPIVQGLRRAPAPLGQLRP